MAAGYLPPIVAELDMNLSGFTAGLGSAMKGFAQLGESGDTAFGVLAKAGGVAAAAIVGAAVAIGAKAVSMASEYDASMTKVQALTGVSADEVGRLDGQVKQLAVTAGKSPKELAEALYFIESAGLRGDRAMEALTLSAKASAAGLGDVKTVADATTSIMNAYEKSGMTAAHATDALTQAVVSGKVSAEQLAPALGRVIGTSAALGVSLEQSLANIATLTRTGMSASQAATSLQSVETQLLKMATPSKNQEKAMHDLGISYADVKQHLSGPGGLIGTLDWMIQKAGGNQEALVGLIPNVRALRDALGTAGVQGDEYAQILNDISHASDGAGATQKAFEITQKSFKQQLAEVKAQIDVWLIQLGEKLIPLLRQAAEKVMEFVRWLKDHKEIAISLAVAIGGPLVVAVGAFAIAMIEAAAPVLAVMAAIGALTYGVIYAYEHWGWFRDAVQAVGRVIRDDVIPWFQRLVEIFKSGGLSGVLDFLKGQFAEWGKALWSWVKEATPKLLAELLVLLGKLGEWIIGTALPWLGAHLVEWGKAFWQWIKDTTPGVLRELFALADKMGHWILDTALPTIASHLLNWGVAFAAWVPGAALDLIFGLARLLGKMIDWVLFDAAPQLFDNLLHWSVQFQNWVGDAVIKLGEKLPDITEKLIKWAEKLPGKIKDGLGDLGDLLVDKGEELVKGLVKGIKNHAGDIVSAIASQIPGGGIVADAAKAVFDNIPGFADGGFIPGPIGQPRLVIAHGGERVLTPEQQAKGVAGSQGGDGVSMTVNLYGSSATPADMMNEVAWFMRTQRMVA